MKTNHEGWTKIVLVGMTLAEEIHGARKAQLSGSSPDDGEEGLREEEGSSGG